MHCPVCGREIERQTVEQIVDQLYALPEGTWCSSWRRSSRTGRASTRRSAGAEQAGFARVRSMVRSGTSTRRSRSTRSFAIGSRWSWTGSSSGMADAGSDGERPDASRLADSIETALRLAEGTVLVTPAGRRTDGTDRLYSERYACPEHGGSFEEPAPGTSRSTPRTGPARSAPGSAAGSRST